MSDTYMPTTESVRDAYATRNAPAHDRERREFFDRWLAAHDAEVRADEREKTARRIETWQDVHPYRYIPDAVDRGMRVAARIAREGDQS